MKGFSLQEERKLEIFSERKVSGGGRTWNFLWLESFRWTGNSYFLWMEGIRRTGNLKFSLNGRFQGERKLEIISEWKVSGGGRTWNFLWMEGFRGRGNLKFSLIGKFQEERKLEIISDWKVSGGEETWNYLWMEGFRRRGNLKLSPIGRFQGDMKLETFSEWKVSGGNLKSSQNGRFQGERKLSFALIYNYRNQEERKVRLMQCHWHRRVFGDTSESDKFFVMASNCLKE